MLLMIVNLIRMSTPWLLEPRGLPNVFDLARRGNSWAIMLCPVWLERVQTFKRHIDLKYLWTCSTTLCWQTFHLPFLGTIDCLKMFGEIRCVWFVEYLVQGVQCKWWDDFLFSYLQWQVVCKLIVKLKWLGGW
jgi:hypothetical protein